MPPLSRRPHAHDSPSSSPFLRVALVLALGVFTANPIHAQTLEALPESLTVPSSALNTIIDGNGGSAIGTVEIGVSLLPQTLKIFLLTGQSNSLGTLATTDLSMLRYAPGSHPAEQGMAVPFFWDNRADGTPGGDAGLGDSGATWVDLAPQLGGYYANNDDHWGPEIGFARMLWNAGYRNFGIVKASRGGGGNGYWVKNSAADHMYDQVVNTVNASLVSLPAGYSGYEIAGLLYLQGESNNLTEATEADIRFDALLTNLKADLPNASALTGVFGEIGGGSTTNRNLTRTSQQSLANSRSDIGYASSVGMSQHDGLHYEADSQLLMGERMASEMIGTGALGAEPLPSWPNLYAWYVSDNGAQPNEGNTIARWASLNDGSAARDLTRTVNGRPSTLSVTSGSGQAREIISFTGTNDLWASSGEFGTLADTRSVAIFCRLTGSANGYLFDGTTSSGRTRAQIRDGDWQAGIPSGSWDEADDSTTVLTLSTWQQHVFTFDDNGGGTDVTHWINGSQVATHTDVSQSDLKGFIIASNGGSPFRPLEIEIAEVAVYDKVLDSADITVLQNNWTARWGTPSGPPFSVSVKQSPRAIPRFGSQELLLVTVDNPTAGASTLDDLTITLAPGTRDRITTVSLLNGGSSPSFNPSAPVLDTVADPTTDTLNFTANLVLPEGCTYLWIAIEPERWAPLGSTIDSQVDDLTFSGTEVGTIAPPDGDPAGVLTFDSVPMSVDIRTRGAHGLSATYRIPGIASDSRGWLHAVYDNRYNFGGDLPGDVDVGYNRSKDGGITWEPQKIVLDFDSSVPGSSGNGVGDPCILWDHNTDTIWVAALWSFGNNAYHGSGPGTDPADTGQYVLTKSTDGGDTWSAPINITVDVKDEPNWNLIYQGPGHGEVMRDGTLIFPSQYRDGTIANDGINQVRSCAIFSTDGGTTWDFGSAVPSTSPQTNEMTLCELDDGRILFSSLCILPDNSIGLLYEKDGYNAITFVRIEEEWLLDSSVDTDLDGLPDSWEELFGTDPNVADAEEDPDGDGMTNAEERIAGTDPFNNASVLGLSYANGTSTTLDVTWSSIPGKTYFVETSEDLDTWTQTGDPITASGPSTAVQITHGDPPKLFVRVGAIQ